ncbi:MAG: hypothetical protein J6C97_00360 [Clostridia bacterium]|nr:hypothetical protein [Clostridia bacterium]
MEIKKINNVVCDLQGCKNLATKQVLFNKYSPVGLNLCNKCLMNLYDLMAEYAHKGKVKNGKKQG